MTTKNADHVDMSPTAVAARLDEVRALYRLTSYLARFRPVETPKPTAG